jgi:hypothetical protein
MKKNNLQDTTGNKNNHKENGVLLVSNQESKTIISNINSIHEVLMKNQDITKQSLQEIMSNIQRNFENTQFDLCGEIVDIKFIKKHGQEIEKNQGIWQEILDGKFDNHTKLTFLTPSIATALSQLQGDDLYLNELQVIDKDSALALAQFQGIELSLYDLQIIDKDSALALAQFQGTYLYLSSLQTIDKDSALALAQFQGALQVSHVIKKQIDKYIAK